MSACNCSPNSGSGWNTPTPGQTVVVPPGSQVVQTPVAYPCHGEQATATGVAVGSSVGAPGGAACPSYPTLQNDVTFPVIGGIGQLRASCAAAWAVPGLAVWIPPFGQVKVTGVSGDLVTFENLSIPPGSTIGSGAVAVPAGPALEQDGNLESVLQLDSITGLVDGQRKRIEGSAGQTLRWGANGWLKYSAGSTFFPIRQSCSSFDGEGALHRLINIASQASATPVNIPSKPNPFNGGKVWLLAESGARPLGTGVTVRVEIEGITINSNGSDREGNTTALIDVTNLSAVQVRFYRVGAPSAGSSNIDGWFNPLGYFA